MIFTILYEKKKIIYFFYIYKSSKAIAFIIKNQPSIYRRQMKVHNKKVTTPSALTYIRSA